MTAARLPLEGVEAKPDMARLAIIIPVKCPQEGKSRLKDVLTARDRYDLNCQLYLHTFDAVEPLKEIARVYVVSKSEAVLCEALRRNFEVCRESEPGELNFALTMAAQTAEKDGASEVMVLPTDIPLLTSSCLHDVIDEFQDDVDVVIVSDECGNGTNLLLWRPIDKVAFRYGADSAHAHAEAAKLSGLRVLIRRHPVLSFDLDAPIDLQRWMKAEGKYQAY